MITYTHRDNITVIVGSVLIPSTGLTVSAPIEELKDFVTRGILITSGDIDTTFTSVEEIVATATIKELRSICEERGLPTTGSKRDLS